MKDSEEHCDDQVGGIAKRIPSVYETVRTATSQLEATIKASRDGNSTTLSRKITEPKVEFCGTEADKPLTTRTQHAKKAETERENVKDIEDENRRS